MMAPYQPLDPAVPEASPALDIPCTRANKLSFVLELLELVFYHLPLKES